MLVNIAGAQAEDEIARFKQVANVAMHPLQSRLITHAAMSVCSDFVDDQLASDAWHGRFI